MKQRHKLLNRSGSRLQNSLLFSLAIFVYYAQAPMKQSSLIPSERIEKAIYVVRGEKVMLDSDLLIFMEWRQRR